MDELETPERQGEEEKVICVFDKRGAHSIFLYDSGERYVILGSTGQMRAIRHGMVEVKEERVPLSSALFTQPQRQAYLSWLNSQGKMSLLDTNNEPRSSDESAGERVGASAAYTGFHVGVFSQELRHLIDASDGFWTNTRQKSKQKLFVKVGGVWCQLSLDATREGVEAFLDLCDKHGGPGNLPWHVVGDEAGLCRQIAFGDEKKQIPGFPLTTCSILADEARLQ